MTNTPTPHQALAEKALEWRERVLPDHAVTPEALAFALSHLHGDIAECHSTKAHMEGTEAQACLGCWMEEARRDVVATLRALAAALLALEAREQELVGVVEAVYKGLTTLDVHDADCHRVPEAKEWYHCSKKHWPIVQARAALTALLAPAPTQPEVKP